MFKGYAVFVWGIVFGFCVGAAYGEPLTPEKESVAEARVGQPDPTYLFVTKQGDLTSKLIELLKVDSLYDEKDSLADVVEKTQKQWMMVKSGRDNRERKDLQDTLVQKAVREKVTVIAQEMGLFQARRPSLSHYDYGICLGAFLGGVRMRVAELVEAWKSGVRFDSLVFLSGERYLQKEPGQIDSLNKLLDSSLSPLPFKEGWRLPETFSYETETDMMKLVWDQVQIPQDMARALEGRVTFVSAPRGVDPRPSTKDTYGTWLREHHPKPGTILAASYPMLGIYQHLVGVNVLGPEFRLDTIAPEFVPEKYTRDSLVSLVYDTVAKCLYEISKKKS